MQIGTFGVSELMSLKKLFKFSEVVGRLKNVRRSGWISHVGIEDPESVADHSFRCAILAMCIGDLADVDIEKLVKMLLLHDIQEALTGDYDIFAKKKIGIKKFRAQEKNAAREILSQLPSELMEEYVAVWEEFEDRKTREAILANDIDKIEMMMQALEYEKEGYDPEKFEEFWTRVKNEIKTTMMKDWFTLLSEKRKSA